jgi:hypothetical protein
MAERLIKNDTDENITIKDLGSIVIKAGETLDLGTNIHALALSDEVITRIGNGDLKLINPNGGVFTIAQALRIISNIPIISPMDDEGKQFVRAESRPLTCTTCFTTVGDGSGVLDGEKLEWDASITTEGYWVTQAPHPSMIIPDGFKLHLAVITYRDSIWIKEGTVYYMDCLKGSYFCMGALVPHMHPFMYKGAVYINITGGDLLVDKYINKHPLQGNVPMGDELNTESCSQELPSYVKYMIGVFVPIEDNQSYGCFELEIYRQRTVDLDALIGTGVVPYTP